MSRRSLVAILACLAAYPLNAAQRYAASGLILKIDRPNRVFLASCAAIPGYMDAMVMPIPVRDAKLLDGLQASMLVEFTLVVDKKDAYAENIRVARFQSVEKEPLEARRLQLLDRFDQPDAASVAVALGAPVPDFTLTDQTGSRVSLSQFAGKAVVAAFVYTSCPLPNYCFRLSNNLARLQKRFAKRLGRDLILLTITIDPAHDKPEVLAKYAATWKADAASWHFLTGDEADVVAICRRFGVDSWPDEGTLTHSLHTVVIDRQGKLAANFEGNQFTAAQLGDFVASQLP